MAWIVNQTGHSSGRRSQTINTTQSHHQDMLGVMDSDCRAYAEGRVTFQVRKYFEIESTSLVGWTAFMHALSIRVFHLTEMDDFELHKIFSIEEQRRKEDEGSETRKNGKSAQSCPFFFSHGLFCLLP